MPINLQGSGNITEGWGPAPQLQGRDLGGLVAAIMRDKLLREQQTQENIADAIKNVRQERQANAYLDAAKEAGLVPQDYDAGGLGGATLGSQLAKQIEAKKLADMRAGLIDAQTQGALARAGKEQTIADYIKQHGTTPGRGDGRGGARGSMVTVTDDNGDPVLDANGDPVQVPAGSKLGQHVIAQQNTMLGAPSASVAANIATKMGIPPQAITDTGVHQGMGFVPGSGVDAQGNPYQSKYLPVSPGDEPTDIQVSPTGTDPKTQQPYQPVIVQKDTLEQLRRALQGSSYKPPREPDASTGVTPAGINKGADQLGPDAQARIKAAGGESTDVLRLRKEAQDAIANGKDPEMVKKRFHDMTGGVL